ncbi:MAG: PQQ-like beta-propeller repeat protein [Candidatus Poribacteria bacterium]|nr:PQQ-like beta-propeller repeat protein [Candidatus Poribacteria bacterium]
MKNATQNITTRLFQLTCFLFLLWCFLRVVQSDVHSADWPDFLGPEQNGKSQEKIKITSWGRNGPNVLWTKEIGTSYGAPAVADGRVYIFARHGDMARLSCLESETGEEVWQYEYPTDYEDMYGYNNGPRCCPVVDEDRVYIFGAEGMLHCVSTQNGKRVWKVDTFAKFNVVQNFFGVASAPAVEGELLIVLVGGSPPGTPKNIWTSNGKPKPNSSGIVAFNKHTGEVVYQIGDELASYASPIFATINGRRWGFAFLRGGLVGFEPATGKIDFHYPWRHPRIESVNASCPVVADELVFISESYGVGSSVIQVRPGGYNVVWKDRANTRNKAMELHWNTAIHHEGYLYGSSGRHAGGADLRCVELETGKVMWRQRVNERASLLWVNDYFIYLGEYGRLMLLKCTPEKTELISQVMPVDKNGRQLINYPAWAAPVLADGRLYIRGKNRLICFSLDSNQE